MTPVPITSNEPEVEELSKRHDQKPGSQPRVSSSVMTDLRFANFDGSANAGQEAIFGASCRARKGV